LRQRALHLEIRDGFTITAARLQQFARRVDGVLALRVVLDRFAVVVERLARVAERRLGPETAQLFMNGHHRRPQIGRGAHQRTECARAALEQRHQCFGITFFAVQRSQAIGGDGIRRIALDRVHQSPRRLMRVP